MKIAIVPVSQMTEQLKLWRSEREVAEAEAALMRRGQGIERAIADLRNRQNELFSHQMRIETARANIARILERKK